MSSMRKTLTSAAMACATVLFAAEAAACPAPQFVGEARAHVSSGHILASCDAGQLTEPHCGAVPDKVSDDMLLDDVVSPGNVAASCPATEDRQLMPGGECLPITQEPMP